MPSGFREQDPPEEHSLPQDPQLSKSYNDVHTPLQQPGIEDQPDPAGAVSGHTLPQLPQLFLSIFTVIHFPEQEAISYPLHVPEDVVVIAVTGASPVTSTSVPVVVTGVEAFGADVVTGTVAEVPTHIPALQYCPLPHTFPHDPQLLESADVLRQIPLHTVWPSAQLIPDPAPSIVTMVVGT